MTNLLNIVKEYGLTEIECPECIGTLEPLTMIPNHYECNRCGKWFDMEELWRWLDD